MKKLTLIAFCVSLTLSACGGGSGDSSPNNPTTPSAPVTPVGETPENNPITPPITPPVPPLITGEPTVSPPVMPPIVNPPVAPVIPPVAPPIVVPPIVIPPVIVPVEPVVVPLNKESAARFLQFTNMGTNQKDIDKVLDLGFKGWLNEQFSLPQTLHRPYIESMIPTLTNGQVQQQSWYYEIFWKNAATADDQLRQRMAWALSQIFVISFTGDPLNSQVRGVANYYDLLGRDGLGNFKDLLYNVSMNPMMGLYLSHLKNQKEDSKTGRTPDENYAREVMQLFSIGLYQLNLDGSEKLDSQGKPIYTYTNEDIAGLAKVFTGLSWGGNSTDFYNNVDPKSDIIPMKLYPEFQSTSAKQFLGKTVATSNNTVKDAVDILFNHPNVAPFITKQLIQHLVMSNPSPNYVERVSKVFNDNGSGVRGDMKSVITAILMDSEATSSKQVGGKLKEPVLRLTNFLRATGATSASGRFLIPNTDDSSNNLGQAPMRSPSVFNYYRPSYAPSKSKIAQAGGVAPEFGIVDEISVAGYINTMRSIINEGTGNYNSNTRLNDVLADYSSYTAISSNPDELIDKVNLLFTGGKLTSATKDIIKSAINSIPDNSSENKLRRAKLAIFLTMVSSDYLIQQ